jgi:hypothetical protein
VRKTARSIGPPGVFATCSLYRRPGAQLISQFYAQNILYCTPTELVLLRTARAFMMPKCCVKLRDQLGPRACLRRVHCIVERTPGQGGGGRRDGWLASLGELESPRYSNRRSYGRLNLQYSPHRFNHVARRDLPSDRNTIDPAFYLCDGNVYKVG